MPTVVPHRMLQPATLETLIEEFVTRDGAVHGHTEAPLARNVADVKRLLDAGRAVVVYDDESETCTIVPRDESPAP